MKYEVSLVNSLDVVSCNESGVYLNYRFRSDKFDKASEFILKCLEDGRIKDVLGNLHDEEKKVEVQSPKQEVAKEVEKTVVETLSLEDMDKTQLLKYIKDNKLDSKELGITSKSTAAKILEAIQSKQESK